MSQSFQKVLVAMESVRIIFPTYPTFPRKYHNATFNTSNVIKVLKNKAKFSFPDLSWEH